MGSVGGMGLLSSKNMRMAKSMLDKNRHRVGDVVGKATDQMDKVSKGRTSNVSAKIDEMARKYSDGAVAHTDAPTDDHTDTATGRTTEEPRQQNYTSWSPGLNNTTRRGFRN